MNRLKYDKGNKMPTQTDYSYTLTSYGDSTENVEDFQVLEELGSLSIKSAL
jgi:hypothetical protein